MSGTLLFRWSAAAALSLHAGLLLASDGVRGGGDLTPHLRLIQRMGEDPGLHNVYAPAYHAIGALLAPLTGLAAYPEWFAFASAALLILAFRFFQRSAGLPDVCAAIFALSPYLFALTRCLPKVEAAGYAVALLGLGLLLRGRLLGVAACVVGAFLVHTAAALLLGLVGGLMALSRRDTRALAALGGGALLALPLFALHLADGCSLPQAFLFSQDDYLRAAPRAHNLTHWDRVLWLANPLALVAAAFGLRALASRRREVVVACVAIFVLYLNELWLAPFGARTTLDLMRGLTLLAIPVAASAGLALAARPRVAAWGVAACALLALGTTFLVVPSSCVSKPVDTSRVASFEVDRCTFRWRGPARRSQTSEGLEVGPHAFVDGSAAGEGATQQLDRLRDLAAHGVGAGDPS